LYAGAKTLMLVLFVPFCLAGQQTTIPSTSFPAPDFVLRDVPHKEPMRGGQIGAARATIQPGVGTPTSINVLAFSGDGHFLAAGKDLGRVVVWNFLAGEVQRTIETGQGIVSAVALNTDGGILATGGDGDEFSVKLWHVFTGKLIRTIKLGQDVVKDLRFDSSGKWLAVTYNAGTGYIFNPNTTAPYLELKGVIAMRFSEDGTVLVTGDPEAFTNYNTTDWSRNSTTPRWPGYPALLAADVQRDRIVVYQSYDGSVRLYRLSSGIGINMPDSGLPKQRTQEPTFVGFMLDGSYLFASIRDRLWLWAIGSNGVCESSAMYSGAGALSPDGRWVVGSKDDPILSNDRTDGVWVWDVAHLTTACGRPFGIE
jgi:WD40 repeat protein